MRVLAFAVVGFVLGFLCYATVFLEFCCTLVLETVYISLLTWRLKSR